MWGAFLSLWGRCSSPSWIVKVALAVAHVVIKRGEGARHGGHCAPEHALSPYQLVGALLPIGMALLPIGRGAATSWEGAATNW